MFTSLRTQIASAVAAVFIGTAFIFMTVAPATGLVA